jgi:endonuclease/exonuclease/phosphatase (EEP) superfamily protein YafD
MSEQQTTESGAAPEEENARAKTPKPGVLVRLFWIVLIPYSIVFVMRLFASFWWLADLFSHFPLQGFVSGIFLIGYGLCLRLKKTVLITCLMTGCYGYELLPYIPASGIDVRETPTAKTLLVWNAYIGNLEKEKLLEAVRTADADYVLLLEIDERWKNALSALDDRYPVRVVEAHGAFGTAFLSRKPVDSLKIENLGENLTNSVVAELPGGVTLYGIHFLPPRGADYSRIRNLQLDQLVRAVDRTSGPVMVAGDLNLSPWSPYFSKLTDSGRLLNLRKGRGLINTWPSHNVIERTSIDHVLPSSEIVVHSLERTPDACGSDHFGLLFRFSVQD